MVAAVLQPKQLAMSGWLQLGAFIVGYEVLHSRDGRLLSEEADGWIVRRPVLARMVIGVVGLTLTAHVANLMPAKYDIVASDFWGRLFR